MTFDPNDITTAAEFVTTFAQQDLAGTLLGEFDLGLPGTLTEIMPDKYGAGTVEQYNRAVETIRGISSKNAETLHQLAHALKTAASYYEQQDAAEYERLKKLEGGLP